MLHGVPAWSYIYRHIIPVISASGIRVIAPDLPGFGKSDKPTDPEWYSITNHTLVIKELINGLNLDKIILYAHDWGSMIGLRAISEIPERFSGAIISNGGLPFGDSSVPFTFRLWKFFASFSPIFPPGRIVDLGALRKLNARERSAYNSPFPGNKFKMAPRIMPGKVPLKIKDIEAVKNRKAFDDLRGFNKPFLTVFGNSDPVTKGWDRILQENIPGAGSQKHRILKAGHFIQEDVPVELAEIIITFIKNTIN